MAYISRINYGYRSTQDSPHSETPPPPPIFVTRYQATWSTPNYSANIVCIYLWDLSTSSFISWITDPPKVIFPKRIYSASDNAMGYGFESWGSPTDRDKIFVSTASILVLGPNQVPKQRIPRPFPRGQSDRRVTLITNLSLVKITRMVEPHLHFPLVLHGVVLQ
jgi:hypothetical protein